MKENRFYCENCGEVHGDLIQAWGEYHCPRCHCILFYSESELREYLDYPEPSFKEPFEKPMKEKN